MSKYGDLQGILQSPENASKVSCRLCTAEGVGSNPIGSTAKYADLQVKLESRASAPTASQALVQQRRVRGWCEDPAHPLRAGRSLVTASSKKPCLQLAYRGRQPSSALIFALEAPRSPSDHVTRASPTIRRATNAGIRGGRLASSASA